MSHIMKLQTQLEEKGKLISSEMGALSKQVKELGDRLQRMEEKDKWIREKIEFLSKGINTQQQEYQSLTEGSREVKQKVTELKSGTRKMAESINSTQDRIEDLQKQLATTIEQERKARQGDLLMVDYCRIACYFEQALCSHVLPEVFNDDSQQDASMHNLLDYINGDNKGTLPLDPKEYNHKKVLSEARERWSTMCERLDLPSEWKRRQGGWKVWDHMIPAEIRALDILRLGRKSILERLKPVGLKFAEKNLSSIENSMSSWEFELVSRFVGALRTNLVKGRLTHEHLTLN